MSAPPQQLKLFTLQHVLDAYADGRVRSNDELYDSIARQTGVPREEIDITSPVGVKGKPHSLAQRRIRWHQQTCRKLGLLERVEGCRGQWRLTGQGKELRGMQTPGVALLAMSTELGIAIWSSWEDVFPRLDAPIACLITSPPFPLRRPRAYGNPDQHVYVDYICRALAPIIRNLLPGGSIALNLSNDIFEEGLPSRSLYLERLTLALSDRFGLHKMDTLIWSSNKAPGPVLWASKTRQQLNVGYEPILWMTNDPKQCFASNTRVLEPHTHRHVAFVASGGIRTSSVSSDGAYVRRQGAYSRETPGRIPRNVISIPNHCAESRRMNEHAREHGLQAHGAPMPLPLAEFLVKFLSEPDHLCVDPWAGRLTLGRACEKHGRRWLCTERIGDYVASGMTRFQTGA